MAKISPLISLQEGEYNRKKSPPLGGGTKGGVTTCKHNLGYWTHKETLAFGLGASGFLNNTRYKNSDNFLDYYNFKGKELEILKKEDLFLEKIMFSLRTSGIPKELSKKLNQEKINYFIKNGFLEKNSEKIILADKGVLYLDHILREIIAV